MKTFIGSSEKMSIDKMGKLRLELSVKEFMKDSVKQEGGENKRKKYLMYQVQYVKGKRGV